MLTHLGLSAVIIRYWNSENTNPENETRIFAMPAVSSVMSEETPRVILVFILHQNANTVHLGRTILHILFPDDG